MRTEPAYQTLRDQLRGEIAAGLYRDGTRLPTESELVARHGLSRQTVRRAFQDLVAEGVVYRVPGVGPGLRYAAPIGTLSRPGDAFQMPRCTRCCRPDAT